MSSQSKIKTSCLQDIHLSNCQVWAVLFLPEVCKDRATFTFPEENIEVHLETFPFCSNTFYLLLGELPIEGKIHRDIFSLFYSIWSNPDTKIFEIIKYLLKNSCENSRTWSAHVKHLSCKYDLEDPLVCLSKDPPSKSVYKEMILTKITVYFERSLRLSAAKNSQINYLNVSTTGLRGRIHPALCNIITSYDVKLSRAHIKFLSGNYLTYKTKAEQSGGLPHCRIWMR